ncbi:MAG: FAD-binding oxidoreductase [Desulfomonilaceae bacterium]
MDTNLLSGILGPQMVFNDSENLTKFAVDGVPPKAVVYPTNLSQTAEIIKLANKEKWTVTPCGSCSKMSIGNVPERIDLILNTSRLDKIIDIDVANLTVTAQAGVKLGDLQDLLGGTENRCYFPLEGDIKAQADYMCSSREYKGVFLPLDPPFPDQATLGGIVATNSSGPKRLRYGLPRDLVLGVRYVTPTGHIVGMGGKTVKNVSGYDVSKIMIGSFGTLGIIGDITFRLLPLPEESVTLLGSFSNLSDAVCFSGRVLDSKLLPTSLEILNYYGYQLSEFADLKVSSQGWCVAIGLEGFNEEVARELIDLKEMARLDKVVDLCELDREKGSIFWKNLANCAISSSLQGKSVTKFKAGFLISRYAEVLEAWTELLSDTQGALIASAGSGTAYAYFFGTQPSNGTKLAELSTSFRNVVQKHEGSMIVELAPAELKQELDLWGKPGRDFAIMKRIKDSVDPLNVLNPGRFLGGI